MKIKKLLKKDFYRYRLNSDCFLGKKNETVWGQGNNQEIFMIKINEIIDRLNNTEFKGELK